MKHSTPFEFAGAIFEVQAPIAIYREWHRHRTQSYSELSARYTPLPDVNYVPTVERLMINSKTNKQAGTIKGADELTVETAEKFRKSLDDMYVMQELLYRQALQAGVPKELARVHLPVGRYSRMRAAANLRNWLQFLVLRMAPVAQYEIRQYANALAGVLRELFPRTMALFDEKRGST
jgi:thymidylate synthase (FAD)